MSVENKTVIITGGARGIGAATSRLYNSHGAQVIIADLASAHDVADELIHSCRHPSRVVFIAVDIANWDDMTSLFRKATERFGRVDIVVANAGIMERKDTFALDEVNEHGELMESNEAFKVIDINLKGTLNTLRLAMHYMSKPRAEGDAGSIVLIASTSGYFGGTGVAAYVASKHGVIGLLRACQGVAIRRGIRVNAVAPFFTPTQITAGYAQQWKDSGLEANTPENVAEEIYRVSVETSLTGECSMVAGRFVHRVESARTALIPAIVGQDIANLMADSKEFFDSIGGYRLPQLK
ncbi:related to NADPH-dependent beta-ketoacyl reductase (rhlG) [Fusarium proliferatum]|nr:related to NADPH-dependent beta-ketoacyl reductase (rhlG) [Fusarium proliferatum]